jgi:ribosomal-protein-alanine N-acetyltransferase
MISTKLETSRLLIRPFIIDDLPVIHPIFDRAFGSGDKIDDPSALEERRAWLQWSILNQEWFPKLHQPPYGDRAVVLKSTRRVIGSVGFVPMLDLYAQIPELAHSNSSAGFTQTEFGLFWVIDPDHQRHGYATEAASALIEFAFKSLHLARIIATTEYANLASQSVIRKLGMQILRNTLPEPPWLQIVGLLKNSAEK